MLSTEKLPPEHLAAIYNAVDVTVNISDAEGFGLSTLESLSCATPIIVNMTGGLQEQVQTSQGFAGFPLFPVSKALIGSQNVPYIYEDRLSKNQFVNTLTKMFALSKEEREEMGMLGFKHVQENYGFEKFKQKWVQTMLKVYENKQEYSNILFKEVA